MLADLFYLSAAWLVPAFVLTLLVGTRWRHSGLLLTIPYMAFIAGLGGVLAIAFVREPLVIVVLAGTRSTSCRSETPSVAGHGQTIVRGQCAICATPSISAIATSQAGRAFFRSLYW